MTLAKLTIKPQSSNLKEFEVLFNPNSYTIRKEVTWTAKTRKGATGTTKSSTTQRQLDAPPLEFGGGDTRLLTLTLFFDVTESPQKDVREETNKIVALTRIERGKSLQPPVCIVSWGKYPSGSDFPFRGVVSSLTQNFTLFRSDGTPVRADLTVVFKEFLDPQDSQRKTDPEFTTHLIKQGDTLSRIAAEVYRDPKQWRLIAEENHLDDPRQLQIGQTLSIPKTS